jgi:hypothetical protein
MRRSSGGRESKRFLAESEYVYLRVAPGQALAPAPVGGRPLAVEEAGLRQEERARADRREPPHPPRLPPDPAQERRVAAVTLGSPSPRDHERVDPAPDLVEAAVGEEPQTRRRAEGPTAEPQDLQAVGVVVPLPAVLQPPRRPREHLERSHRVQHLDVGIGQHCDTHRPRAAPSVTVVRESQGSLGHEASMPPSA